MDMSDPHGSSVAAPQLPGEASAGGTAQQWLALVGEFGADVAGPLTAALERIDSLIGSGRIRRADLKALRDEVHQARQAGMLGQQLAIVASGAVQASAERLVLDETVQSVLSQRASDVPNRSISVEAATQKAEVMADPALMFCLLNALFEWALGNSAGHCSFKTAAGAAAGSLQLECRFEPRASEALTIDLEEAFRPPRLNALAWRILEQTALAMGVSMHVQDDASWVVLTLQFLRAAQEPSSGVAAPAGGAARQSRSLAGSQVLVISSRREVRVQVRDALRNMGMMIDFVSSVSEASEFCQGGPPDAVIIEAIQRGERFTKFREEVRNAAPHSAFVEIVEQGRTFEKSGSGAADLGRVGRDVIDTALPAALLHELTQAH
jgi:CheY-like chemotaxis protein